MTLTLVLTGLAIVALLSLSAFFSGSETALTAASRPRIYAWEKEGDTRAATANQVLDEPERLIGTILLCNNLVNILASALATSLFLSLFGQAGVAYATIAMTALVVVFAEVLPKTYAISKPDTTSLAVAPIMRRLIKIASPIVLLVERMVSAILRMFVSIDDGQHVEEAAKQELRGAIDLHHREGAVVKDDKDMLGGILDLKDLEVLDVMVHRTDMHAVCIDDPPDDLVDQVLKSAHTRLPVWRDQPENIIGILHVKDLLRALNRAQFEPSKVDIEGLCKDPWFVPETTGLKDQLDGFLERKAHFAIVVDEYGEVQGLVTLEDILEEIVGQIADEHDIPDNEIRPQKDGTVNVDGSVPIRDLNRRMDWDLPDDEATTIAGLVIHEAETIPEVGQAFTFYGFRFEILRKQRNKIVALRITQVLPVTSEDQPAPPSD